MTTIDETALAKTVQRFVSSLKLDTEDERKTAITAQLQRLEGMDKRRGRSEQNSQELYAKRVETIMGMVDTVLFPNVTRESVLQREGTVGHRVFYSKKKDWYQHPLFREVLEIVLGIYRRWKAEEGDRLAAKRLREWNERAWQSAVKIMDATDLIVNTYLEQPYDVTVEEKDGNKITKLAPKFAVRDAAILAPAADKLARMSMDRPTDRTAEVLTGPGGGPIEQVEWTVEEWREEVARRRAAAAETAALFEDDDDEDERTDITPADSAQESQVE